MNKTLPNTTALGKLYTLAACLIGLLMLSTGATAQTMSALTCDDFLPSAKAIERYPDLLGACEAIVEREGELYGKFTVKVRKVSNRNVTLYLPATDHTFQIKPEGNSVVINGKKVWVRDLQRGEEMHIYLAASEFGKPDIEEVVLFSDVDILISLPAEAAPMLPNTASPLPLFGLAGLLLLSFAFFLRYRRLGAISPMAAILVVSLATVPAPAEAAHHEEVKPMRMMTSMVRTGAIVEAVYPETRELKLIDASGRRFTTLMGPEVKNFDQIQPRDRIVMEYLESVAILVVPEGTPQMEEGIVVEVAETGAKPSVAMAETYLVKATVLSLNLSLRRATLRFAEGDIRQIHVKDDVPMELINIGDEVRFRITRSVAVSVQKVGAE